MPKTTKVKRVRMRTVERERPPEHCGWCAGKVVMMVQKRTGYCSQLCQKRGEQVDDQNI